MSTSLLTPGKPRPLLRQVQGVVTNRRVHQLALGGIAFCFLVWTLFGSPATGRQQRAVRGKRGLLGYSLERLAALEKELGTLSREELLAHPLMTDYPAPTCAPLTTLPQQARLDQLNKNKLNYLVAINLSSSSAVLPSLIHAIHSLLLHTRNPTKFHVAIYENGSEDNTSAQLFLLRSLLDLANVGYTIHSDLRPHGFDAGRRIAGLAQLRNLALKPLTSLPPHLASTYDRVLFLNDVILCEADLLEILLEHEKQGADMSCGMDYKFLEIPEFKEQGYPLLFYDVWVARDMMGLPFYKIDKSGEWKLPSPPLSQSLSRKKFEDLQPFQVYSCWNGVTILPARVFLPPYSLKFTDYKDSDEESECLLFCRSLWNALARWRWSAGNVLEYGKDKGAKIMIVPKVAVGYDLAEYEKARNDGVEEVEPVDDEPVGVVDWKEWPPKLIASYPYAYWANVRWIPSM